MTDATRDLLPGERPRFWSEADCRDVLRRLERVTQGGGVTTVAIWSTWTGNVRWARNQISTAGETRDNTVLVDRNINGAQGSFVVANDVTDAGLEAAARHAERVALLQAERGELDALVQHYPPEQTAAPTIFSDATYQLDAAKRASTARRLAQAAAGQGLLSAGYVQVSAHSVALLDTMGHVRYFPFTQAQCSVTVRDPRGIGSGWAGDSHWDWAKIDADRLTRVALDKCLQSRSPVRVEPGRYTTILEPQAAADFVGQLVTSRDPYDTLLGRTANEDLYSTGPGPFNKRLPDFSKNPARPGFSRLGERVVDERLSLGTDPADPELGYPPFNLWSSVMPQTGLHFDMQVYHPVTWVKEGVLQALSYERDYAAQWLRRRAGLPNPGGFRMSVTGPTSTVDEMVANTKRGLLVTRFDQVQLVDYRSTLCRGYTRDGLWLVEDGKITQAVKNFQFTEAILAKLNAVDALGAPQRVFHPMGSDLTAFPQPVIVPAMTVRDFSFTALSDAV